MVGAGGETTMTTPLAMVRNTTTCSPFLVVIARGAEVGATIRLADTSMLRTRQTIEHLAGASVRASRQQPAAGEFASKESSAIGKIIGLVFHKQLCG